MYLLTYLILKKHGKCNTSGKVLLVQAAAYQTVTAIFLVINQHIVHGAVSQEL